MKILYVFPHPDDESFGPARAIAAQVRAGHEVFLLTNKGRSDQSPVRPWILHRENGPGSIRRDETSGESPWSF